MHVCVTDAQDLLVLTMTVPSQGEANQEQRFFSIAVSDGDILVISRLQKSQV